MYTYDCLHHITTGCAFSDQLQYEHEKRNIAQQKYQRDRAAFLWQQE